MINKKRYGNSLFTSHMLRNLPGMDSQSITRPENPNLVREYGHHLEHEGCLLLFLGQHLDGSFSDLPIKWAKLDTAHIPKHSEQKIVVSLSASHPILGGPYDIIVDSIRTINHSITQLDHFYDPYIPLQFYFPYQSSISMDSHTFCIHIQISLKDDSSQELVATGIFSFIDTCYLMEQNDPLNQKISSHGTVIIPLVCTHTATYMGSIEITYLLILPYFTAQKINILPSQLPSVYWKSVSSTKVVGHRGFGANHNSPIPQLGENTILSFVTAASLGAEYIEFDVQMTRDGIPVVYHDFSISELGQHRPSVSSVRLSEFIQTKNQLRRHSITGNSQFEYKRESTNKKTAEQYSINLIREPLTTLEQALMQVPVHIGFNIELKYPNVSERKAFEVDSIHELNAFCDGILNCLYNRVAQRCVMLSSFNPQVCILLALKQPHFPVFFLSTGGSEKSTDIRCNSIDGAISFARNFDLFGIVLDASSVLAEQHQVEAIKGNGLVLFTYGHANNQIENVQIQKKLGVDAVIVDNVVRIRRELYGTSNNITESIEQIPAQKTSYFIKE